jgi:septal ring factor EnvC (AmiA/AmiB activator)
MKIALIAACVFAAFASVTDKSLVTSNPVRKVVTLLQSLQKKVQEEGERDFALFKKYTCYCKKSDSSLQLSITDATAKVPQLGSGISEAEDKNVQLKAAVAQAQKDRASALQAVAEATAIREKAAAAFAAAKQEADSNLEALTGAISAVENGMAGSFLQTPAALTLKKVLSSDVVSEGDRHDVLAFISGTSSEDGNYAPQSGEIVGILKEIKETMAKDLAEETSTEKADVEAYTSLMTAKKREVAALTAAIEEKTVRSGELAVEIVQMKNDLSLTQKALLEDQQFLADLQKNCATKERDWNDISKTRSEELIALSETIKILNDDDALELFKKTLPSTGDVGFVQLSAGMSLRAKALRMIQSAPSLQKSNVQVHLILSALRGKKVGFEKVIAMIDDMVALLKKEQDDDEKKKEYCATTFDSLDDKRKALDQAHANLEARIAEAKDRLEALASEIKGLESSIASLDKEVADATEQRQAEHVAFTELIASNSAAKKLLGIAKNRLNQFYNPKLYVAPAKRQLSREDQIVVNMGGTAPPTPAPGGIAGTGVTVLGQISTHSELTSEAQPPPPPESFKSYSKQGEGSTGVIAMLDLLVKDLDKEITEAEVSEKDAQAEYEEMMADSRRKRADDSKAAEAKRSALAQIGGDLEASNSEQGSKQKELAATLEVIASLHSECDWLLQYFDVRKEARTGEIESLVNAKAVLSGADFSMVQTNSKTRLRGRQ